MKVKCLSSHSAEITLTESELEFMEISVGEISFCNTKMRRLFLLFFRLLESACGFVRDGKVILMECAPVEDGHAFYFDFTDVQGDRVYIFEKADDMLDAMNHLNYNDYFNTSSMDIQPMGGKFLMHITQSCRLSRHNLAVLSEYCC